MRALPRKRWVERNAISKSPTGNGGDGETKLRLPPGTPSRNPTILPVFIRLLPPKHFLSPMTCLKLHVDRHPDLCVGGPCPPPALDQGQRPLDDLDDGAGETPLEGDGLEHGGRREKRKRKRKRKGEKRGEQKKGSNRPATISSRRNEANSMAVPAGPRLYLTIYPTEMSNPTLCRLASGGI